MLNDIHIVLLCTLFRVVRTRVDHLQIVSDVWMCKQTGIHDIAEVEVRVCHAEGSTGTFVFSAPFNKRRTQKLIICKGNVHSLRQWILGQKGHLLV
uniref:Putative secreted protein n=1 Tax=Amblyomma parvum TaxID=251391 RepID=A0A023FZ15_AMBPA